MAPICPYCKKVIEAPDIPECPACTTPHHLECWVENRGCAVYGCSEVPEDEPKLAVPSGASASSTRGGTVASQGPVLPYRPARRMIYMVLGLFFGAFGMHNFYAGRIARALTQLLISCLTLLYALPISALWAYVSSSKTAKDDA